MYSSAGLIRACELDVRVPSAHAPTAPRSARARPPEGTQDEFDAFFQKHRDGLLAFLWRRTASRDDAEEVAQEACIRLLAYGVLQSRPEPVWKALLYRVATNLAIDHYHQARRRAVLVDAAGIDSTLPGIQPQPDALAAAEQELGALQRELARMPAQTVRIFLLSRVHQHSYSEIARRCGVSVKTVEKHISRALRRLRPILRADHE